MRVQRYDYADIKATKTDEGFLQDSPVVGRVGIQEYIKSDGSVRRELRLPEDVFNTDALNSMRGKPITVDHPKAGKVTSATAHKVTVGTMLSAGRQDGNFIRVDMVIHSPDSIGDRRQLSLGYTAEMDETPGDHPEFGRYDAIQRNINVNHLSVVKAARAGAVAKLNLDSMDQDSFSTQQEQQTMSMVKVKLDSGLEYDAAPEVSAELAKLRKDAEEVAVKLESIPKLQAERDTLKARVDGIASEIESARAQGKADAEAKVKLDAVAASLKVDAKDKTDRQIKEAVIKAVTPALNLDGKDDNYVDLAFDVAVSMRGDAAMQAQRQAANTRTDSTKFLTSAQRREQMIARTVSKEEK